MTCLYCGSERHSTLLGRKREGERRRAVRVGVCERERKKEGDKEAGDKAELVLVTHGCQSESGKN